MFRDAVYNEPALRFTAGILRQIGRILWCAFFDPGKVRLDTTLNGLIPIVISKQQLLGAPFRHGVWVLACWLIVSALSWNIVAAPAQAQSQSTNRIGQLVVVFDGSGSMWGKLAGTDAHKFAFLRQELVRHMRDRLAGLPVGLTTFGARSGGSCQSATTELAPSTNQSDAFEQLLDQFNPQGRGPVALGLSTAASAIDPSKGPGRLLLIHDSPDNCGQDVCELADGLAGSGIVVDVISLAQKPKDKGSMACLTKATGGTLIEAEQASDVVEGLKTIVASLSSARPTAKSMTRRTQDVATPKAKLRPSSLRLMAKLKQSGELINSGIEWQISAHSSDYERTFDTPTVDVVLVPDRYQVRLRTATWSQEQTVDMKDGQPATQTFIFDGGLLTVSNQSKAQKNDPHGLITITKRAAGSGLGQPVWAGPASTADALPLPAGAYDVAYSQGLYRRVASAKIDSGQRQTISFRAALAKLHVKATGLRPSQQAVAKIRVLADAPGEPGKRVAVAHTSASSATFQLPPGPYEIVLSAFGARSRSQIVLGAGQSITETLALKQLALKVASYTGASKSSPAQQVRYRLWRAEALDRPLLTTQKAQPVLTLAQGNYRIESHIGRQNAILVREFAVNTEGRGSLDLHHRAGEVVFSLSDGVPLVEQNAYWEVSDRAGRLVWRGFATSPQLTLAAGEYAASVDLGKSRYQAKFAVVAGPRQIVALDKF